MILTSQAALVVSTDLSSFHWSECWRFLLSDSVDFEKFGSMVFNLDFKTKSFLE